MSATLNDAERREVLSSIGLNPDGAALTQRPSEQPTAVAASVPVGIDPHTMPVTDIVFDPAMVEQFTDLSPRNRRAAADHLFAAYKSYGRDRDRNSLLHRRIGEFLASVHGARQEAAGGGFVKGKMRLADILAKHGITENELEEFVIQRGSEKEA